MSKKILLIDDSINLIQVIKKRFEFELAGVEVYTATNGKDGLEIAFQEKPDLILLDINMPDLNGDEVLTQLKSSEDTKNITVIILTARGPEKRNKYISLGATDYIPSPFDTSEIVQKVRDLFFM